VQPGSEPVILNALGEDGFTRLTAAFYRRVQADDLLGPMYRESLARTGEDLAAAEGRLRDFLRFRFGASDQYIRDRGHPRLRGRHMPFPIDRAAADRWMRLMTESIAELGVPEPVAAELHEYFSHTATFMINRP
jgi:hemoglobin